MGNSAQKDHKIDANFKMEKYVGRGLPQSQILRVKQAFDSFEPENGYIPVEKVINLSKGSRDIKVIESLIGKKEKLNFDQFFSLSSEILKQQLQKDPNIVIDSSEVQATCLFCPYAQDKSTKAVN